jgi:hypothetical protein
LKPIQTRYRGYAFRSRIEARYAVLFDSMKLEWEYEPQGYVLPDGTWYLPDFFVRFPLGSRRRDEYPDAGYWVEIKAIPPTPAELQKLELLSRDTSHIAYLFCGPPSNHARVWSIDFRHRGGPSEDPHFRYSDALRLSAPLMCCSTWPGKQYNDVFDRAVENALGAKFERNAEVRTAV